MDMGMGMDMGTNMFQSTNMELARDFWYIIAGVLGLFLITHAINFYKSSSRLRRKAASSVQFPTRPNSRFLEIWATLTAVGREASYPQLYVPTRWLSWMTPPPMGRVIVLLIYWAIVIYLMTSNAIIDDVNFWERIGFRNAWVTIMQVPLLYLLASKCSVLGLVAGISYERFNWLHRWVARTIFITASVHGWHFYQEYAIANIVDIELSMMPMIKYGFGAWGILLWSLVSSLAPIRHLSYELFVLQHLISAILFLWVVYQHIPDYARYNIWFAIAAFCFDRFARIVLLVWQNLKLAPKPSGCKGDQRIGHLAQARAIGDSITVLTIKDVHFKWRAGQHLYLWIPRLGPTEAHPYTIACAHQLPETCICNSIQLVVRKHKGFSQRLHNYAAKAQAAGKKETLTAFVTGPYGVPPRWDIYETLILISASTGASFTLPILEGLLQMRKTTCTKRIDFLLTAKQGEEIKYYVERLHELIERAKEVGIELLVHIAVTRSVDGQSPFGDVSEAAVGTATSLNSPTSTRSSTGSITVIKEMNEKGAEMTVADVERTTAAYRSRSRQSTASSDSHVFHATTRPDVEAFIRGPVEATGGETSVVVCGGQSLVARVRNCVASLSDERAVHKGTGAQGIHLHVEEYAF